MSTISYRERLTGLHHELQKLLHPNPLYFQVNLILTSEQALTTWCHDGSNTTGWACGLGSWTINSTGTELYSPMTSSSAGIVHAVFYYDLETSIVVGNDMKFEVQFNYTTSPMKQGGINLMAQQQSQIVWRPAATVQGSGGGMYALNYYTSNDYDSETAASLPSYLAMWFNTSDDTTRTNIGDGVVSTSEHAGSTRVINRIVLNFWFDDDGANAYADVRVDWLRLTGGAVTDVNSPEDIEMEYSELGRTVRWSPYAYFPDRYELSINGTAEDSGS